MGIVICLVSVSLRFIITISGDVILKWSNVSKEEWYFCTNCISIYRLSMLIDDLLWSQPPLFLLAMNENIITNFNALLHCYEALCSLAS